MEGAHDLGGLDGFGPVVTADAELTHHEAWELRAQALGIIGVRGSMRPWIERLDPPTYLDLVVLRPLVAGRRGGGRGEGPLTARDLARWRAALTAGAQPPVTVDEDRASSRRRADDHAGPAGAGAAPRLAVGDGGGRQALARSRSPPPVPPLRPRRDAAVETRVRRRAGTGRRARAWRRRTRWRSRRRTCGATPTSRRSCPRRPVRGATWTRRRERPRRRAARPRRPRSRLASRRAAIAAGPLGVRDPDHGAGGGAGRGRARRAPTPIDAFVEHLEHRMGPHHGARVVARAWVDPAFKDRLLADGTRGGGRARHRRRRGRQRARRREHRVRAQPRRLHAVLVLPVAAARRPADLVQELRLPVARRRRAPGRAARVRLASSPPTSRCASGTPAPPVRYLVLPARPAGTEHLTEDAARRARRPRPHDRRRRGRRATGRWPRPDPRSRPDGR